MLGDWLIVGVNSDESIAQYKGLPITNDGNSTLINRYRYSLLKVEWLYSLVHCQNYFMAVLT